MNSLLNPSGTPSGFDLDLAFAHASPLAMISESCYLAYPKGNGFIVVEPARRSVRVFDFALASPLIAGGCHE